MMIASRYVIAVPKLSTSSMYYRDILGFDIVEIEDPGWLFYVKDKICIMAGECPDALPPGDLGDHSYFAYLVVDDIETYFELVKSRGGHILKKLRHEPWGMHEFGVRTVDGHRLMVGQQA